MSRKAKLVGRDVNGFKVLAGDLGWPEVVRRGRIARKYPLDQLGVGESLVMEASELEDDNFETGQKKLNVLYQSYRKIQMDAEKKKQPVPQFKRQIKANPQNPQKFEAIAITRVS